MLATKRRKCHSDIQLTAFVLYVHLRNSSSVAEASQACETESCNVTILDRAQGSAYLQVKHGVIKGSWPANLSNRNSASELAAAVRSTRENTNHGDEGSVEGGHTWDRMFDMRSFALLASVKQAQSGIGAGVIAVIVCVSVAIVFIAGFLLRQQVDARASSNIAVRSFVSRSVRMDPNFLVKRSKRPPENMLAATISFDDHSPPINPHAEVDHGPVRTSFATNPGDRYEPNESLLRGGRKHPFHGNRLLCPPLVVPLYKQCYLIMPLVGHATRATILGVKDLRGNPVVRCDVTWPDWKQPKRQIIAQLRAASEDPSLHEHVLARCETVSVPSGQRMVYVYDKDGHLFGQVHKDPHGGVYFFSAPNGSNEEAYMVFSGDFASHTIRVENLQKETLAETEQCKNFTQMQIHAFAEVDVSMLLCGFLCIEAMEMRP